MNRVKAGIFSLTASAPADDDGSYLRWHLLDHMPEQYQLPGIVHGLRWIADGDYADHRLAAHGPLEQLGNAVHYIVGEPVEETFDDFVALGRALRESGRFPVTRPSLQVAGLRLLEWQSSPHALISAEVVPFRPHRGVLLIVEEPTDGRPNQWLQWLHAEHYPALLATTGHGRRVDIRFDHRMARSEGMANRPAIHHCRVPRRRPSRHHRRPRRAHRRAVAIGSGATGIRRAAADHDQLGSLGGCLTAITSEMLAPWTSSRSGKAAVCNCGGGRQPPPTMGRKSRCSAVGAVGPAHPR